MLPNQLTADNFAAYPPEARKLVTREIEVLRSLPLGFLPLLLREAIAYDWKFPAERKELDQQFAYLNGKSATQRAELMRPFTALSVSDELAQFDWVNDPVQFSEKLSAYLWASHQMDAFRKASVDYVHALNASTPTEGLPVPRLSVIVFGQQVTQSNYRLFRKLERHGAHYDNVDPNGGLAAVMETLRSRAQSHPAMFAHWYIDGATVPAGVPLEAVLVSYDALQTARAALVSKMTKTMQPGGGGPELLRTELAQMHPSELQLPEGGAEAILSRFKVSVLTQGSGTQIFSTTFVQWTAREALRRAQPLTLVARFAPRQREAMVKDPRATAADVDAEGALIDADMAAYYTWLNQQRLPGASESRMLVWFEGHREVLIAGPTFKAGTKNSARVSMKELLAQVA